MPNAHQQLNKQVKADFKSKSDAVDFSGIFPMKVVFEGPNVLDGLKSLIPLGIAKAPLPPHLANLHSSASNSFSINSETPLS